MPVIDQCLALGACTSPQIASPGPSHRPSQIPPPPRKALQDPPPPSPLPDPPPPPPRGLWPTVSGGGVVGVQTRGVAPPPPHCLYVYDETL